MLMRIQVKPAVLTILVVTITACNVANPVHIVFCLVAIFVIHTPQLEGIALQLSLAKSPHNAIKVNAQTLTINHDACFATEAYTASNTSSNAIGNGPAQIQVEKQTEQLTFHHKLFPTENHPGKTSKKKTKRKSKEAKMKASASTRIAADGLKERADVVEHSPVVSASSLINPEGEDGGGWTVVSRKRNNVKRAPDGNTDSFDGSSLGGK